MLLVTFFLGTNHLYPLISSLLMLPSGHPIVVVSKVFTCPIKLYMKFSPGEGLDQPFLINHMRANGIF